MLKTFVGPGLRGVSAPPSFRSSYPARPKYAERRIRRITGHKTLKHIAALTPVLLFLK